MSTIIKTMMYVGSLVIGFIVLTIIGRFLGISELFIIVFLAFAIISWFLIFRFSRIWMYSIVGILLLYVVLMALPSTPCSSGGGLHSSYRSCDCIGITKSPLPDPLVQDAGYSTSCTGYRSACYSYNGQEGSELEEVDCSKR